MWIFAAPVALLNLVLILLLLTVKRNKQRLSKTLAVALGLCILTTGYSHNRSISSIDDNFRAYFKQREYIVSLVKEGKLKGEVDCLNKKIQNLDKRLLDARTAVCTEAISLPEDYKGLSLYGIRLIYTSN